MKCKTMRPSAWAVATPLLPFMIVAWAGSTMRRKSDACWNPDDQWAGCETSDKRSQTRPAGDIVDTAVGAGTFATLVQAVGAAGLVDALKADGPLTVFAPTDDAFGRLPEGTLEELLEDKERLTAVLQLHVVAGRLDASTLSAVAAIKTVQGQSLDVDTSVGVKVGSAYVIQPDIETSNGVIHAIDSVLLPE